MSDAAPTQGSVQLISLFFQKISYIFHNLWSYIYKIKSVRGYQSGILSNVFILKQICITTYMANIRAHWREEKGRL